MNDSSHHGDHASFAHPAPLKLLYGVFFVLVALTILTVVANDWPLGKFDIWVALTIACIKATLVALFFMHMYWDKGFNVVAFLSSFVFVTLFIGFTLLDTNHYQDTMQAFPVGSRPDAPVAPAEPGK